MASDEKKKWCPFGRISIQNWEGGQYRDAVPGSHNMVVIVDRLNGKSGKTIIPASPCQKELCALYKIKRGGDGYCGLENRTLRLALNVAAIASLLALAIVALTILNKLG